MASSEHPQTPEQGIVLTPSAAGIQTPPETPAHSSIPLAPLPKAPTVSVEQFTRVRGYLDAILVVLVLAFAFLAASTPAINSDFLRQLATGRLLAQGDYHFGVDPFTYTSGDAYWVNHSWLFALGAYVLYQIPAIGGVVVVVCKALLIAALAIMLLRMSRRAGQSLWIPLACTALAILCLSPWAVLRPVCLSFFFLGLTLWLLTAIRYPPSAIRPQEADGGKRRADSGKRLWWLLPPLFALWVNCDVWFLIGPLTVALYLLGAVVQYWQPLAEDEPAGEPRRELGTLTAVLVIGLAACLLNPHHIHAFTLPPEFGLSPAADLIQNDRQFHGFFLSPVRKEYYAPNAGLSVAGLSYWVLLLAGGVSLVLTFGRVPWWRLPVWLGFALLSLYSIRAIPFFAVVAGPITALNWLDFAVQRWGRSPRLTPGWRQWSLGGRVLSILIGLVLLAAAVPGWLQAEPYDHHRIGWRVDIDPSLEQAALQIKTWRKEGRLPADARWFNTQADIANYLAWFAPGERAFFDQRVMEFRDMADDYEKVREKLAHAFGEENATEEGIASALTATKGGCLDILRKWGVHYWIIDAANSRHRPEVVARWSLFANPDQWALCYLHGRIAIFAWRDPEAKEGAPDPSAGLALNLERLAFGPEAEQAPLRGPETAAPTREWWDAWWQAKPPIAPERWTADLHDIRFMSLRHRYMTNNSRAWQWVVAAGAVGAALPHGPVPNSLLTLGWSCTYSDLFPAGALRARRPILPSEREALNAHRLFMLGQDGGPVESLYLAIRAARRALLDNPEDAQTYLLLAQAYQRLSELTRERFLADGYPLLGEIRRTQMTAAYQNALRLGLPPRDAASAHDALFREFYRHKYLDLAVHHLREELSSLRTAGPSPNESPAQFGQQLEEGQKRLTQLDDELKRRVDSYEVNAANRSLRDRIRMALDRGLGDKVREELSSISDPAELARRSQPGEQSGMEVLVKLVLDMGRLDDARALLTPDPELAASQAMDPLLLGPRLRLAAAQGNYEEADQYLTDALRPGGKGDPGKPSVGGSAFQINVLIGRVLLGEAQRLTGMPMVPTLVQTPSDFWLRRWRMDVLETSVLASQQHVENYFLRGWLALEAGRYGEARKDFEAVLDMVVPPERWMPEVNKLNVSLDPYEVRALRELPGRQATAWAWSNEYLKWMGAAPLRP